MSNPSIRRFIEDRATVMKWAHSHQDWKYSGYEQLILDCGIEMEVIPLPKNIESGLPQMCYQNCYQLITKHKDLTYVEGYAVRDGLSFPVSHAWLMNKQRQAIDPTWGTSGIYYLGVPLSIKWVKTFLKSRRKNGKIQDLSIFEGNYLENFSLLKQGLPDDALVQLA